MRIPARATLGLFKQSATAWNEDYAPSMGAALSYYTLFSIAPLLLIVIAVAGLVFGADAARGEIFGQLAGLIGADGANSFVARAVEAPKYNVQPAATVNAYSYWRGIDMSAVELYPRPNRFIVAVPTNDDLVIIAQGIAIADGAASASCAIGAAENAGEAGASGGAANAAG